MTVTEVPEDKQPQTQLVLKVADVEAFRPDPAVEAVTPFEDTRFAR